MKKKLTLKEIFQGSSSALGIKEICFVAGIKKEISAIRIRYCKKIPLSASKNSTPVIVIISPEALSQLDTKVIKKCGKMPEHLFPKEVIFLFMANTTTIPLFLNNFLKKCKIPAAASIFDKYYLKSRLIESLREKLRETVFLHGVVFESQGKGIILTGSSGIGKTTAALGFVKNNNYWVADDFALVNKNNSGELVARGHRKIKNLINTRDMGIISVHKMIEPERIKKRTKLCAVIEVTRDKTPHCLVTERKKKILGCALPCWHVRIPRGSYFDKNLLKKCVEKLSEENK